MSPASLECLHEVRGAQFPRLRVASVAAMLMWVSTSAVGAPKVRAGTGKPASYAASVVAKLPTYVPEGRVSGVIRLWGHGSPKHDFMGKLLRAWEVEFHRYQPDVRIIDDMYGSASAVGALYTGAGNLAILGEEVSPAERKGFERELHYAPTVFEIATGSVDVNYYDYAHMVFVNRANPIDRITMGQLARVLGDPPAGAFGPIRVWGQLGLRGPWVDRRIQPYSWAFNQDFGLFLRARVLGGSGRWNPQVRQFVTYDRPNGTIDDRGQQILQALARDPAGIAVSNIRFSNYSVKILKLAATSSGPYVLPTVRTLISQKYPLTRIIPAVVDLPPGQPMNPVIREFLRFILSREGQRALIKDSGYLPLGPKYIHAQLRKLDQLSRCRVVSGCRRDRWRAVQQRHEAPPYSGPGHPPAGVIRVWGNPTFLARTQKWATDFRTVHPKDRVTVHLTGNDTGMAGLYTGEADVALLDRAATASELQAFQWVFRRAPACLEIGSMRIYFNSGRDAQLPAAALLHFISTRNGEAEHRCASTR